MAYNREAHRLPRRLLVVALTAAVAGLLSAAIAFAFHGGSHTGAFKTWNIAPNPPVGVNGKEPRETVDDVTGLTNQVSAPAVVTVMRRGATFTAPAILYWNPVTNVFKSNFLAEAGIPLAVDINRSSPASPFGGGDAWGTVFGNSLWSPYVNFRGTNTFRRWNAGASQATGIRVNSANGKVYFGDFATPGRIFELTPATNTFRSWTIGNRPSNLVIDPAGNVYATAVATGIIPDQIVRLDPSTNVVTRWNVPGGGFSTSPTTGTPNFITRDDEGQIWFTETASNELGRLNPLTNVFEEFTKPGIGSPNAIATSGILTTLQAFFTEATGDRVSVLTRLAAFPTLSVVAPTAAPVAPSTTTVPPADITRTPTTVTITPVMSTSASTDGSGIDRFPIPASTDMPTGMSRVAFPQTVFGSLFRTTISPPSHVFQFVSGTVVAVEEGKVTGGGFYAVPGGAATFGFVVQRKEENGPVTGQLEYHNHATGENVHSVTIDTLLVFDSDSDGENDTAVFSGTCTNNMVPCTFQVKVEDKGEPGVDDTFQISGVAITPTSGTLLGGNIQIHKN